MSCSKNVFILDIDGVAAIHMPHVRQALNLPQINGKDYDLPELTHLQRTEVFAYMATPEYVWGCEVDQWILGLAIEAHLSGFVVGFLTARYPGAGPATIEWCGTLFPFYDFVIFAQDKRREMEKIQAEYGETVCLIDDLPSNVVACNDGDKLSAFCYYREGQEYSLEAPKELIITNKETIKGMFV